MASCTDAKPKEIFFFSEQNIECRMYLFWLSACFLPNWRLPLFVAAYHKMASLEFGLTLKIARFGWSISKINPHLDRQDASSASPDPEATDVSSPNVGAPETPSILPLFILRLSGNSLSRLSRRSLKQLRVSEEFSHSRGKVGKIWKSCLILMQCTRKLRKSILTRRKK